MSVYLLNLAKQKSLKPNYVPLVEHTSTNICLRGYTNMLITRHSQRPSQRDKRDKRSAGWMTSAPVSPLLSQSLTLTISSGFVFGLWTPCVGYCIFLTECVASRRRHISIRYIYLLDIYWSRMSRKACFSALKLFGKVCLSLAESIRYKARTVSDHYMIYPINARSVIIYVLLWKTCLSINQTRNWANLPCTSWAKSCHKNRSKNEFLSSQNRTTFHIPFCTRQGYFIFGLLFFSGGLRQKLAAVAAVATKCTTKVVASLIGSTWLGDCSGHIWSPKSVRADNVAAFRYLLVAFAARVCLLPHLQAVLLPLFVVVCLAFSFEFIAAAVTRQGKQSSQLDWVGSGLVWSGTCTAFSNIHSLCISATATGNITIIIIAIVIMCFSWLPFWLGVFISLSVWVNAWHSRWS